MTLPKKEPVLRFAGASMAFRLEAALGERHQVTPEELVGKKISMETMLGHIEGTVRDVTPYVDPALGPGHWVVVV